MRTWKILSPLACAAALAVPAPASAAFMHVVAPGESLSSVAAADGLTVDQLAAANGMSPSGSLVAGSSLAIPPQGAAPAAPAAVAAPSATDTDGDNDGDTGAAPATAVASAPAAAAPSSSGGYLVQPGDTLSGIAARYGVSVGQLAGANGLSPAGILPAGATISVNGAPVSSSAPATAAVPASYAPPATAPTGSGGAQPTGQFVSPSQVGSIAAANGVPASLAEAIGYQESGFNNNMVSPSGATGVMQIEPGTWNYIGSNLAGGTPLSPSSATDNIRGGVLLLHSLLNATGGNAAQAAAAYYQGLGSVQQHGMYSDTQQYVNNVMALQHRFGGQ